MEINFAQPTDYDYLTQNDHHISPAVIQNKLERGETIIIRDNEQPIGWLRFGYFWDEIPFMNMLALNEAYRGRGLGRQLVEFWENEMRRREYKTVLTSTQSDEQAQHFYRKLGYRDCGALLLPGQTLEIILIKEL